MPNASLRVTEQIAHLTDPAEPRLTGCAFEMFHQVGGPPEEIFRFDQMVTLNGFHGIAGGHTALLVTAFPRIY